MAAQRGSADGAASSANQPSQRRVFISHTSGDNAFGKALADWLRAELGPDYMVFYDSHGGEDDSIPAGAYWQDVIQAQLMAADVFVVIETPAAMASRWVQDEIGLAWSRKNSVSLEHGLVIAPVLLETCAVPPWLTLIQYADLHVGADEAKGRERLLAAVRRATTLVRPMEVIGPPFDLSELRPADTFIGREDDVKWVIDRLTGPFDAQLANIAAANGQGGIGKTALAAEVVRRLMTTLAFPDGIAVVDCRGKASEADAQDLLLTAISRFANGRQKPQDKNFATLGDVARRLLGGKCALVVFDNVEVELPAGKLIAPLRTAGAAVLLTSRAPLDAAQGASLRLDLLPEEDALALFLATYGEPLGRALTEAERTAARAIVVALGRHTLAVKLAAANAATQRRPLAPLAAELRANPLRDAWLEDSETAVAFVLASSVAAMSAGGQRLFAALGAFASADVGRNTALALAEALGDDETKAERSLRWIFDLRLADPAEIELPGGEKADRERLRLHPLTQAYARDLFAGRRALPATAPWDDAQREQANSALAGWYAFYTSIITSWGGTAYLALMPDEANIIGALYWALTHDNDPVIAHICDGMRGFWRDTGRTRAGLRYLPLGADAAGRIGDQTGERADRLGQANITSYLGDILQISGQLAAAESIFRQSLDLLRAIADRQGESLVLSRLGQVTLDRGQLEEAAEYFQQSLQILRQTQDRRSEGTVLSNLGQVALLRGQMKEAADYFEQSLSIFHETQDRRGEGIALAWLGQLALSWGQLDQAEALWQQSLHIREEIQDLRGKGSVLSNLGQVALNRGRLAAAAGYIQQSLPIRRETQDRRGEGIDLTLLGQIALQRGRLEAAADYFQQSLPICRETQNRQGEGVVFAKLGRVAEARGDYAQAAQIYRESVAILHDVGDRIDVAAILEALGALLLQHSDDRVGGVAAFGEAIALWQAIGLAEREQQARKAALELGCRADELTPPRQAGE